MVETQTKPAKVKKEKIETKVALAPTNEEVKTEIITEAKAAPNGVSSDEQKQKVENKSEKKVAPKVEKVKKDVAVANLISAGISTKHSVAICRMIRRKSITRALEMLELVMQKKLAVPMIGAEIPHRKRSLIPHTSGGSGRFPMNATKEFIGLVKQLKANCEVNGIENPQITIAMANLGSRPYRREGRKGKRTHVHLEAREYSKVGGNF
jgi:ribosomal protein L22